MVVFVLFVRCGAVAALVFVLFSWFDFFAVWHLVLVWFIICLLCFGALVLVLVLGLSVGYCLWFNCRLFGCFRCFDLVAFDGVFPCWLVWFKWICCFCVVGCFVV